MQIAQAVGGYSLGGADLLRRAMGKKKPEEMAKQRKIFLAGATGQGLEPAHAEGLFDLMETFAGYGFNKSHSAAYALLSYQTAWLKRHYPAAFMAAVLSSDMDNTDKVVTLIDECRSMALTVEPPDVNRSAWMFQARDERTIVYGLGAVKGVGHAAIEAVVEARAASGPFADLFDLCRRLDLRRANRRVLEALIRSGSLDSISPNRATAMAWLGRALQAAEQQTRNRQLGQDDLFGLGSATPEEDTGADLAPAAEWPEQERLAAEKDTLGLYLTGHPIEEHERELGAIVSCRLKQAAAGSGGTPVSQEGNGRRREGERRVVVAGLVVALRARLTQSGKRLGFLTLDDRTARLEVILFGDAYQRYRHLLAKDRLLVIEGDLGFDEFSDGYRVAAERVLDIAEARELYARRLVIGIDAERAGNGFIPALREALTEYREGHCPVWIDYHGAGAVARLRLGDDWRVRPTDDLVRRLEGLVAPGSVRLDYSQ